MFHNTAEIMIMVRETLFKLTLDTKIQGSLYSKKIDLKNLGGVARTIMILRILKSVRIFCMVESQRFIYCII